MTLPLATKVVGELLDNGHTVDEICTKISLTRDTILKHVRAYYRHTNRDFNGLPIDPEATFAQLMRGRSYGGISATPSLLDLQHPRIRPKRVG